VKLSKNVVKEPINEIIVQGTYVKIGKSHTGLGTWYAFKGGLYAASPWLPIGSYARVTNRANGKSVIVEINDRGPFGKNRIIDLDKVAFQKIASLGAGVIDTKVEEILN
ncbi:MAG: septal ring lytic transglycosylase RlpA family protein, partial [Patescibacteria group bacterium]